MKKDIILKLAEISKEINDIRNPDLVFEKKDYNIYSENDKKKLEELYIEYFKIIDLINFPMIKNVEIH